MFHSRSFQRRGNILSAGESRAEIAGQDTAKPTEIADIGRIVQAHVTPQVFKCLRRGRLSENGLRDVSRQNLRADKYQHGDSKEKEYAHRNALGDQFKDRRTHPPDRLKRSASSATMRNRRSSPDCRPAPNRRPSCSSHR